VYTVTGEKGEFMGFLAPTTLPTLIPVGGGKGGVGKTVVTTSLAYLSAEEGYPTLLVDMDFGGSNTHTWLGIPPLKGEEISSYFLRKTPLENLIQPTFHPKLFFLKGSTQTLLHGTLPLVWKRKLIKDLKALPFPYIFLDLGAGDHLPVVDFFLIDRINLLLFVPEKTSFENAYRFLKTSLYRQFVRSLPHEFRNRHISRKLMDRFATLSIEEIVEREEVIPRELFSSFLQKFQLGIVLNQVLDSKETLWGEQTSLLIERYLHISTTFLGILSFLPYYPQAIRTSSQPVRHLLSHTPVFHEMKKIYSHLLSIMKQEEQKVTYETLLSSPG